MESSRFIGRPKVVGKSALRDYWTKALERAASLHFVLDHILWDDHSQELLVLYAAELNGQRSRVCEMMRFSPQALIIWGEAMHGVQLPAGIRPRSVDTEHPSIM